MNKQTLIALTALFSGAFGSIAVQQSWKGMIEASPATLKLDRDAALTGLVDFRECGVLIEELPDALKDSVSSQEIADWTRNRLSNIGVKVLSDSEQTSQFNREYGSANTDEAALRMQDRFRSKVYVNIGGLKDASGRTVYTLTVEVHRGIFMHPGYFFTASVWDNGGYGQFGSSYEPKTVLRERLNKTLDELETDWKVANPR